MLLNVKIPSEMEVAPPPKLLTLFTLFTLLAMLTVLTVLSLLSLLRLSPPVALYAQFSLLSLLKHSYSKHKQRDISVFLLSLSVDGIRILNRHFCKNNSHTDVY